MVWTSARTPERRDNCSRSCVSASHPWGFVLFAGRGDIQPQLDSALQDVNDKYLLLEETEKQAVRKALIEERGRFCTFISMLRPVIVSSWKALEGLSCQCAGAFLLIYVPTVGTLRTCCVSGAAVVESHLWSSDSVQVLRAVWP